MQKIYQEEILDLMSLPSPPSLSVQWYGFVALAIELFLVVVTLFLKEGVQSMLLLQNVIKINLSGASFYVTISPRSPS